MKKSIVISLAAVTILACTTIYSFASTGVVSTDTLRLRKEPSANSTVIELLSLNDEVEILEEENGWYKVKVKIGESEYTGYVSKEYIKAQEENKEQDIKQEESKQEENETEENPESQEGKEENQNSEDANKTFIKILQKDKKIYITPTINSLELYTLSEEKEIEVGSEVNGWSYITLESIRGWVRTEDIEEKEEQTSEENKTEEKSKEEDAPEEKKDNTSSQKKGYISGSSVNFREQANSKGKVISKLAKNAEVTILEEKDGWTKVEYSNKTGYVSSEYISDKKVATTSRGSVDRKAETTSETKKEESTKKETSNSTSSKGKTTGAEIVAYAKKYLGCKYVYGGTTPKGFDCSGFTAYVYKNFGYSLSHSSSAQSSSGKAVSKSNLQAGDIVCFSTSSKSKKVSHVGIYIGSGKFIHAANSRKGVITSSVSGAGYYYVCGRRII